MLGFLRVVDVDGIDIEHAQAALKSAVAENLVTVLLERRHVAGNDVQIHVLGVTGTAEEEPQVDAALQHVEARVGQFQKPVEETEMKGFAQLNIGKHC
ncbi:MAG: hypothetical protein U5K76_15965 [Woeseiaceae bacterium]|nr:hypothetical protein [Woeseiaceae bacterium]